ncbi:MAG: MoaD/ThiS family protein [Candidatus Micrarchaeia archaeon]
MRVKFDGKWRSIRFKGSVGELLEKLGLNNQVFIVKANGRIVPETKELGNDAVVELLKVILGG